MKENAAYDTKKGERLKYPYNLIRDILHSDKVLHQLPHDADLGVRYAVSLFGRKLERMVVLRYEENLTFEEISAALPPLTPKECSKKIHFVREKLRNPPYLKYITTGLKESIKSELMQAQEQGFQEGYRKAQETNITT